jgi:hypothetical protein
MIASSRALLGISLLAALGTACSKKEPTANAGDAAATRLPAPVPSEPVRAIPVDPQLVVKTLNPDNLPPYDGPTGSVEGRVTVTGDPAPSAPLDFSKCPDAASVYGKVFREGAPLPDGSRPLADALVVVTEYKGFIPERNESKLVKIEKCAITPRTIDLTFGQRLDVQSQMPGGKQLFAPALTDFPQPALMVAPFNADPVKLWPMKPGFTQLTDRFAHGYLLNDVYTLLQPLHTVTNLEGTFRIDGIPVGPVKVNTRLRYINRDVTKTVDIRSNVVSKVDLQMEYHARDAGPIETTAGDAGPKRPLVK